MPCTVELVCVGNELLIGKTLNTNARWLAAKITRLGGKVTRVTTVGDEVPEIARSLREAIARKPTFLITSGGLGPTFDDQTLLGVAKATGSRMRIDAEALRQIRERYARIFAGKRPALTAGRTKMAKLPAGGSPIGNPVGTAPGVILKHRQTTIISLPGVPREMEAIFNQSVAALIRQRSGAVRFLDASLKVHGIVESALAPLIDRVMRRNPGVYIKSHPKGGEGRRRAHIELHFSTVTERSPRGKRQLSRAVGHMIRLLAEVRPRPSGHLS